MKYLQQAPFNVATGGREEKDCQGDHWRDPRGRCVFCGKDLDAAELDAFQALSDEGDEIMAARVREMYPLDRPLSTTEVQMVEGESTGVLCVMDSSGDTKTRWHRNDPASIERARAVFQSAVARHEVPFRTAPNPAKLTEFDPDASEIVTVRQYQGG